MGWRNFKDGVLKIYLQAIHGPSRRFTMTGETHPEIMSLYSKLCAEAKIPVGRIKVIESEDINATARRHRNDIVISSGFIDALSLAAPAAFSVTSSDIWITGRKKVLLSAQA